MTVQDVLEAFEKKQSELIEIGTRYGLDHPDVLKCSQELDVIHNRLQAFMMIESGIRIGHRQ
ncbi:aspartyl-phosphate phosphatase Spo0E family protein [Paenibacillus antri]|uniref:aspartyl-phosphate phosphatase Spo0E family protein n=1 Tax=Paenibacillus antri TaxID=2582848 RepID=UPI00130540C7|nr:aspartyl-phosphate phosphatase Spo0E family protein [Paenibacillus antri]